MNKQKGLAGGSTDIFRTVHVQIRAYLFTSVCQNITTLTCTLPLTTLSSILVRQPPPLSARAGVAADGSVLSCGVDKCRDQSLHPAK